MRSVPAEGCSDRLRKLKNERKETIVALNAFIHELSFKVYEKNTGVSFYFLYLLAVKL